MINDPYSVLGISKDASKEEIKKAYRKKAKEYHPDLHPDDPVAAQKMNEVNEAYDMLNNPEKYKAREQQNTGNRNPYGNGYGGSGYGGGYQNNGGYQNGSGYGGSGYGSGGYQNNGGYQNGSGYGGNGYGNYGGFNEFDFEEIFGFGRRQTAYMQKPNVQPGDSPEIREAIDLMNAGRYEYANRTLNSIISVKRDARWYYLSALANHGLGNQMMAMDQIQRAIDKEPYNNTYKQVQQSMRQSGSSYNEAGQGFQSYADGMSKMCMSFFMLQCFCTFCRC